MGLEYILGVPIAAFLTAFGVYLCGRLFGLGLLASLRQLRVNSKETKGGTRQ